MQSIQRIAIVGNPNCGKTTLFNWLTGRQQTVGNWSGVTVTKNSGRMKFRRRDFEIIDLPGIYSLTVADQKHSIDEQIACDFILSDQADLYINIVDGANLKRHLYLTLQLLEMGVPCIIAVNMMDVAERQGIQIDLVQLSKLLGCPVIPLSCRNKKGIDELKQAFLQSPLQSESVIEFDSIIENEIAKIISITNPQTVQCSAKNYRWLAIRLLEQDEAAKKQILDPSILNQVNECIKTIEQQTQETCDILIADSRYRLIHQIVAQTRTQQMMKKKSLTQQIDQIFLHRWIGLPIFFLIIYLMFEISMNLGTLLQPLFDLTTSTLFIQGPTYLGDSLHFPTWATAILAQGIGLGINTVAKFIPQIALLFLFMSVLEDSGYLARAAFVMDRFMQTVGLPGKSFIPLIVGFGCNVPAIMATRNLESRRDRILTALMAPFMSCGARLAIFVVFADAFFPRHGGLVIFLLYLFGIFIALITGYLYKTFLLKGENTAFLLEMPTYHLPKIKNTLLLTWQRSKGFIFRAGKVIIPICVLVGSLNAIQMDGTVNPNGSSQSILSQVGRIITPVFSPMGLQSNNWPATVGLITGTLAKEVVVGTLNTLYSQENSPALANNEEQKFHFWQGIGQAFTATWDSLKQLFTQQMINPFTANEADHEFSGSAKNHMSLAFGSAVAAFAYLLFVLLYVPCVSTVGVLAREIGKSWAVLSTAWSFSIAYTAAVIFYQAETFLQHPVYSLSWICGLLIWQILWFASLKIYNNLKMNQEAVLSSMSKIMSTK